MRFIQTVKMWWMFQWRLACVAYIFALFQVIPVSQIFTSTFWPSVIGAGVLAFGFRKAVRIFPLVRLIFRKRVVDSLRWSPQRAPIPKGVAPRSAPSVDRSFFEGPRSERATQNGRMTGYEPRELTDILARGHLMTGTPGKGLAASGFTQEAVDAGAQGELRFAQAVKKYSRASALPLLDRLSSYWSVAMPTTEGRRDLEFSSDIDCVFVVGSTVYLIDVKNYKSGDLIYRSEGEYLQAFDKVTGEKVGKTHIMSQNMELATRRFQAALPQARVIPRVVFMPTDRGAATVDGVYWPGNIPAVDLVTMLEELGSSYRAMEARQENRHNGAANVMLSRLIK